MKGLHVTRALDGTLPRALRYLGQADDDGGPDDKAVYLRFYGDVAVVIRGAALWGVLMGAF